MTFLKTPQPITITAGANDVRWDTFLLKCFQSTCGTASDIRIANGLLKKVSLRLERALNEIEQRSGGSPPEVIVSGYNPLSSSCSTVESRISAEELAWASSQISSLNQVLAIATSAVSFATFTPLILLATIYAQAPHGSRA